MTQDNVEKLRPDSVMAQEIREEIKDPLVKLCDLMNRAHAAGLTVNLAIAPDAYGRFRADVGIVKPL